MEEQINQDQQSNQEAPKTEGVPSALEQKADPQDAEKNKGMAILAYIIFFIPLLAAKDSKFAMYHANQGLNLFLAAVAIGIIGSIIPIIGWFIIIPLGQLAVLVVAIMGIINASKGEMKELPIIGKYKLL